MVNTAKARHSKAEIRWGTPSDIVERSRNVMGSIDLDPCSSVAFNEIVQAKQFFSLDDRGENGLELPWQGNIFVNPPGNLVREFWKKAYQTVIYGQKSQLIFIGFSVEQLALLAVETYHPMDFSFCILRKRMSFTRHDGFKGSPSHANYVCGMNVNHGAFISNFKPLGRVYKGGSLL